MNDKNKNSNQFDGPMKSFNLDKHCLDLMQDAVFYGTISRYINKIPSTRFPHAAVCYDKTLDNIVLHYNPNYCDWLMSRSGLSDEEKSAQMKGLLRHEFSHIFFDHLGHRLQKPYKAWNSATDAAINSFLIECKCSLPPNVIIPGQKPILEDGSVFEPEPESFQELVLNWPKMKTSEWYFSDLKKTAEERNWNEDDDCMGDSFDDHSLWDDIPEEEREFIRERVRQIVEKGVKAADGAANGWGNIPLEYREKIRNFVSRRVDWRVLLRSLFGRHVRGERALSIKKINKKYAYIHPGTKRGYTANILIAIDESGSVSDEALSMFFGELSNLARKISFTVLPFDHTVSESDLFSWKKGMTPKNLQRVRAGGTCFDAPTAWANDPKRRGKYELLVILTDGQAPKPLPSRIPRAWVICPGGHMVFDTNETVITMDKTPPSNGPWG